MYQCEVMAKIVCGASSLKSDNYLYKGDVALKYCELCNVMSIENVEHVIMHCPYLHDIRTNMLDEISALETAHGTQVLTNDVDMFATLLGNIPVDIDPELGLQFLKIVAKGVYRMYRTVMMNRAGIG